MASAKPAATSSNLKLKANIKIVKPVDETIKPLLLSATHHSRPLGTSRSATTPTSHSIRIDTLLKRERSCIERFDGKSKLIDANRASSVMAIKHGYLLQYHPPIIKATKPKSLNGPFYISDVPQIRAALDTQYRQNKNRRKQDYEMTQEFFYDLNLDRYFSNEKNWNDTKFNPTSSLVSAFNAYLPHLRKSKVSMITQKYIDSRIEKRNQQDRLNTQRSHASRTVPAVGGFLAKI